jgi:hypothetical protein
MQIEKHISAFAVYYSSISGELQCIHVGSHPLTELDPFEGLRAREDGPLARGMERHAGGTN